MTTPRITTSQEAERALIREAELRRASRRFPSDELLRDVLADLLEREGLPVAAPVVLARDRSGRSSTFTNEVVTCALASGRTLKVLCKYARSNSHPAFGHRRGIEYEIQVYRDMLRALGLSTPVFYGSHFEADAGEHWLVMEYLEGGLTVNKGPQPAAIISAAQWIGAFHAASGELLARQSALSQAPAFIEYDAEYFSGWPSRVLEFSGPIEGRYPWLRDLCRSYTEVVPAWLAFPRQLIHGEYTVHNVLLRDGETPREQWVEVASRIGGVAIAPIDWESAAVSFGEIDLAFVLDGSWPEPVTRTCVEEYKRCRWGEHAPADFDQRFKAAQLYKNLRWMGDRPEKTLLQKTSWRFTEMEALGRALDLL